MTATDTPGPGASPEGVEGPDDSTGGDTAAARPGAGDGTAGSDDAAAAGRLDERLVARLALAATLAPFVVAAIALLVTVGGDYYPVSDHALTELQVRSVGRDEVLVGLYSRGNWNHPGPAAFYLMAPFYWVTGGLSASMNIAALAINGAAVAGMALVARRRGGLPLMLITLIGCGLLMRMLGADFLQDPWNCFVTTLPFGLLIYLSWAMWGRAVWALPVAAAVASAMAQAHVGFAVLGPPLLVWGAVGLVVSTALLPDPDDRTRALARLLKGGAVTAGVLLVLWLPPVIEGILHSPSNFGNLVRWFRDPDEDMHSVADGWRVMTGQFGGVPEWLSTKRDFTQVGESPFIDRAPLPWLLVLMLVSGVVLARRSVDGARTLVATTLVALAFGILAVARTVGLAFDYRLRWTYLPAMLAFVIVAWAGWTVVAGRWPRSAGRLLVPGALGVVAVLGAVNVVTGATAGTPQNANHDAMVSLTDQVLGEIEDPAGTIFIDDAYHSGAWHARGLVLQLERRGIDVGIDRTLVNEYGRHRVADPDEIGAVLLVTMDDSVDLLAERPNLRRIAYWTALPEDEMQALLDERDALRDDIDAGSLDADEQLAAQERLREIYAELPGDGGSIAYRAAVFVDESFVPAAGAGGDG
jgi:hypothetical protein